MDTKALRQKILDLAIRGKLVPQDPNDEPAEVLLERIREQKQQMFKEGKLKKKDIKNDTIIFVGEDNLHYEKFADGSIKCIEDEIPFEVPEGWAWCRLSQIIILYSGQDLEPSRYNDNSIGIPYITGASNFEDGRIIINRWTDSPTTHATIDDLLLTCKGSGVGKMVWCNIENAHIARQIMALRCIDGLYKNYLEIVMLAFLSKIVSKANGLIPGLSRDVILNMTFPLPPFNEQTQIYHKSKEILSCTQQVDKETEKLIDIINITKSKILDLAIRGKLVPQNPNDEPASVLLERIRAEKEELIKQGKIKRDKKESIIFRGDDNSYYEKIGNDIICIDEELPFDIPHNWSWCRLGNIGDWAAGSTPSRSYPEYYNGTIPWLKTGDLNDGYITNIPESISEEALKNTSVRLNPSGSVLIAMYGATIGKLGILTFPATTNQACCACSPLDGINNHYLFYYLLSQKDNFVYRSVGGAQPNISKEKIVTTLMPVPPYEEQRQILDKIDIFFDLIRDIEKSLN